MRLCNDKHGAQNRVSVRISLKFLANKKRLLLLYCTQCCLLIAYGPFFANFAMYCQFKLRPPKFYCSLRTVQRQNPMKQQKCGNALPVVILKIAVIEGHWRFSTMNFVSFTGFTIQNNLLSTIIKI